MICRKGTEELKEEYRKINFAVKQVAQWQKSIINKEQRERIPKSIRKNGVILEGGKQNQEMQIALLHFTKGKKRELMSGMEEVRRLFS